jgi:insertion element IS1 protein InsB
MRFKCIGCDKTQVKSYTYKAYSCHIKPDVVELTKEGLGIRSTARFLCISPTTVIKRILSIASTIKLPVIQKGLTYEVDEIRTFIKRKDKLIWIVCALERESRQIAKRYSTNHIERFNLTLRTHLKRLNRRTICFSRSLVLLNAILKIYFWFKKMMMKIKKLFIEEAITLSITLLLSLEI